MDWSTFTMNIKMCLLAVVSSLAQGLGEAATVESVPVANG